tara:strand:+ start:21 stop:1220 length:1200 start_codon:yes stop_codon:yes gene_type:complete
MTVRITKPEFNLREKLSELDKPTGLKGNELMRSDTAQEARDLVSAGRKNLIINGAMQHAQRGTSTTTLGYLIDRFLSGAANVNVPTYAQVDVASGTQPYAAGFRKAAKFTGGNNAVHSNDVLKFNQKIEAQNIATSGWDYKSGASFITLSFWVKSSVGQTFFGRLQSEDGTKQNYAFSYDVPADTWTKVVKTIPGNSNITIDNDNGIGLDIEWTLYRGVDTTASSTVVNQWQAYSASSRLPDGVNSTWHDTNAATWEITGVQLEVGKNATDFEHRDFGEELLLCQRYYENVRGPSAVSTSASETLIMLAHTYTSNRALGHFMFKAQKRTYPTIEIGSASNIQILTNANGWSSAGSIGGNTNRYCTRVDITSVSGSPLSIDGCGEVRIGGTETLGFNAEL